MAPLPAAVPKLDDSFSSKEDSLEDTKQSYSHSSHGVNNIGTVSKEQDSGEVKALIRKENRAVNWLRFLVIAVLAVAAVVCSYVVHHSFQHKEYDSFLEEYDAVSTRLVDLFRNDVLHKLWIGKNLAHDLTVLINAKEFQAPNITIPSFVALAEASIKLGPVVSIKWSPLLMDEEAQRSFQAYVAEAETEAGGDEEDGDDRRRLQALSSPVWQVAPAFGEGTNQRLFDLMTHPIFERAIQAAIRERGPVLTQVYQLEDDEEDEDEEDEENDEEDEENEQEESEDDRKLRRRRRRLDSDDEDEDGGGDGTERAISMVVPVFDAIDDNDNSNLLGTVILDFAWEDFLSGYLLIDAETGETLDYGENIFDTDEVLIVLENTCGQTFSIKVEASAFEFVGEGNLHDPAFSDLVYGTSFEEFDADYASFGTDRDISGEIGEHQHCAYRFLVYPTQDLLEEHSTNQPLIYAFVVALIFVFTSSIFVVYDCIVARRQRIITKRAIRTNAIVASFFPEAVRNRIIEDAKHGGTKSKGAGQSVSTAETNTDPIADFFPNCSILFADIAGFTAWSSEREPTQVFKLLERTFHDFDRIAKQLGVFKVETIGDCYVAAVGVPTARSDHAVVMAKFARLIVHQMKIVCHDLEQTLGPSTADLDIRVGIHSGPCTAGVLRGEKTRFQLFGDTMNTCARMESSGLPGRIHVSGTTANLLTEAGRQDWLIFRNDTPELKGKGKVESYWLRNIDDNEVGSSKGSSTGRSSIADRKQQLAAFDMRKARTEPEKLRRLVKWNVKILSHLLQKLIASRGGNPKDSKKRSKSVQKDLTEHRGSMINEVQEVLTLSHFDAKKSSTVDPSSIELSDDVLSQLSSFVEKLAKFYHAENPFHNWEHASHVTMSVSKLLSRIVKTSDAMAQNEKTAADMHDNTFGITSDPLVQFAVVLSALIHDVDHPGVTNAILVSEKDPMALKYKGKSVAEQNSVDLAFELLMKPEFQVLRDAIYTTDEEFHRFRNTIINLVLATDIMDKELGALRKDRWAKAFSGEEVTNEEEENVHVCVNRKATIVLEHLIQASDVAHTMQHWHVYKKWNELLFQEVYEAYLAGRIEKDPSESWYKGEIGFFDFYIIPLAKKLETCGVFGVSSHEYLQYAELNRQEWVLKGEDMVKGYLGRLQDSEAQAIQEDKYTMTIAAGETNEPATVEKVEPVAEEMVEQSLPPTPPPSEPVIQYEDETWC